MDPRDEPQDSLAILKAAIDQQIALAPEIARAAYGQFQAFTEEGFTAKQALYLTAVQLQESPGQAPS
jgi:hypothetical protein